MKKNTVVLAVSALLVLVSCASASKREKPPVLPPPFPAASVKTGSAQEDPQQQPEIPQQQPVTLQQQAMILLQQSVSPQSPPQFPQAGGIILEGAFTHTVRYRDRLSQIAERFYGHGKGYYYGLIMLASHITNPNLIVPGTTLTIPVLPRNLDDPGARARLKAYSLEIADILAGQGYSGDARNMRALSNAL